MTDLADVFAAVEQPDIAALVSSRGTAFTCHTWKNVARNSIDSAIFIEQEHGQRPLVIRRTIRLGEHAVDCPRVIRSGDFFVALWLEATDGESFDLWMARLDTTDMDTGWVSAGSIFTSEAALYDVCEAEDGSTSDFIVVQRNSDTTIAVRRHDGPDWVSTDWITNFNPAVDIAERVLGCYWDDATGNVIVSYVAQGEESPMGLWTASFDQTTGTPQANEPTFPEYDGAQPEYCSVTQVRTVSDTIAIVAEVQWDDLGSDDPDEVSTSEQHYAHAIVYREVQGSTCDPQDTDHYCNNLNLVSRAFVGHNRQVYVLASFKSVRSDLNWEQRNYYVLDLHRGAWSVAIGWQAHPILCATFNRGTADARRAAVSPALNSNISPNVGGKRMNHLSHIGRPPPFGPDTRTATLAVVSWTRTTVTGISETGGGAPRLVPGGAAIEAIRFYLDNPWTPPVGDEVVAPADRNFIGPYPWTFYQHVEAGAGLVIAGGAPALYDGHHVVELGFPWYPEIIDVDVVPASGESNIVAGAYYWTVTYEWTDARGQLHQSRPATPWQETVDDLDMVHLTVRSMNISCKDNAILYQEPAPINLVLWRSDSNNSTIFRRVYATAESVGANFALSDTPINTPRRIDASRTGAMQVIRDGNGTSRGDLLPYQFTSGAWSPLTPDPPPAGTVCALWRERLWLANGEDPRRLNYSKRLLPASGSVRFEVPAFNPALFYDLDEGEQVTAMLAMDSQLVVWTTQRIYLLDGEPVGDDGSAGTLQARVIHSGTGCINPDSVVLAPPGAFFQSRKGYYCFTREHQLDYVSAGADIEEAIRIAGQIRAATLLEDRHQIRLVGCAGVRRDPVVLVYDYFHRLWSRLVLQPGTEVAELSAPADALAWRGLDTDIAHVVLQYDALLIERRTDDDDTFIDDDADAMNDPHPVRVTVGTGWIHLAGITGYKLVSEIVVQLEKPNDSAVIVSVEYILDGGYSDPDASETFYFPEGADERLRLRPTCRKITAFRLTIAEPASGFRVHTFTVGGTATIGEYSIEFDNTPMFVTASVHVPEDAAQNNNAIAEGLATQIQAAGAFALGLGSAIYEVTSDANTVRVVYRPHQLGWTLGSLSAPAPGTLDGEERNGVPLLENLKVIGLSVVVGVLPGTGKGSVRAQGAA